MRIGRLAIALILLVGCRLQEPDHRVGDYSPARLLPATVGANGAFLQSTGDAGVYLWSQVSASDQGIIVPPALAATWTIENQSGDSKVILTDSGNSGFTTLFFSSYSSTTTQSERLARTTLPGSGAAYAVVARFKSFPTIGTSSPLCGFAIENAAGQIITWDFQFTGFAVYLQVLEFTNYTTLSGSSYSVQSDISPISFNWVLIEHTTGSPGARNFYWSNDAVNYFKFFTMADTSFINNNETKIGLDVDQNGSAGSAMILESFAQDVSFAALISNGKLEPLAAKHP